jgi:hypothetical protein
MVLMTKFVNSPPKIRHCAVAVTIRSKICPPLRESPACITYFNYNDYPFLIFFSKMSDFLLWWWRPFCSEH